MYSKFISSRKLLTPALRGLVPWRDLDTAPNKLLPLKKGLDENHLRWPDFNQRDLTYRQETFLVLLESRAIQHPKDFAFQDHFRENRTVAQNEGLVDRDDEYNFKPGLVLVSMTGADPDGDEYGAIYNPANEEEAKALLDACVWPERASAQTMVNQRRIYRFLEGVVTHIVSSPSLYKVAGEERESRWRPAAPTGEDKDPEVNEAELDAWVDFYRDTTNYTQDTEDMVELVLGICRRQQYSYGVMLQGLKTNPSWFYEYFMDMREHSHHEIMYRPTEEKHAWVSHVSLQSLFSATPERECWERALANRRLTG